MSDEHFAYFIESLETLENLLHAETQAIAAKDLDTIDSIMSQKDLCLKNLLSAKDRLNSDPRNNDLANHRIDFVMNLQARNAKSFEVLKNKTSDKNKQSLPLSSNDGKARTAYLNN
tara:strand:- start:199 stop:546 length:348 start_codon:yes stop_codon:yes gene_type:complete